jgi:glycosyltransferase involved in cell wall biosynthesis
MRILVDYRPALRRRTGVGEYMHELARAYTATTDDEVVLFTSSWRDRLDPGTAVAMGATSLDRRVPVRLLNLLWHRARWPPVEWLAGRADVVHAAHPLLIPARDAAQVVTVHDLFFLDDPGRARAEIRRDYRALAADHARRADAVVTPSFYTRQLVVDRFGVDPARVHACRPGAPRWRRLGHGPHVPADGTILFMGTLEPRKNVGVLLDAYARLATRLPDPPRLVLAGGATPEAAGWLARLEEPPLAGRATHLGYVRGDERESVYAGARVVVLPSLDEGFGLPALEAMSAGVPVIVSTRGALPEVVGGAGLLVDPADAEGLADAIESVVCNRDVARARGQAGLEQARTFTWPAAAASLGIAYREAVARRRRR